MASSVLIRGLQAAIHDNTDFTITAGQYFIRTHGSFLAQSSPFFKTTTDDEGPWKESEDKQIDLPDDSPFMVARMIQFLYMDFYDYKHDSGTSAVSIHGLLQPQAGCHVDQEKFPASSDIQTISASVDLEMYIMADKFGMEKLRKHAFKQFQENFSNVAALLILGHRPEITHVLNRDAILKKAVALKISESYAFVRTSPAKKTESTMLESWFKEYHELSMLVMDALCGVL